MLFGVVKNQATTRKNSLFIIGKDEVGGSNPPSSSKENTLNLRVLGVFFCFLQLFYYFRHNDEDGSQIETDTKTETAIKKRSRTGVIPARLF